MSIIHTARNMVVAHEPEPGDLFVRVVWFGPGDDGKHPTVFRSPLWPVEQFQASVDWAVAMADNMRSLMYVEPVHPRELRKRRTRQ